MFTLIEYLYLLNTSIARKTVKYFSSGSPTEKSILVFLQTYTGAELLTIYYMVNIYSISFKCD